MSGVSKEIFSGRIVTRGSRQPGLLLHNQYLFIYFIRVLYVNFIDFYLFKFPFYNFAVNIISTCHINLCPELTQFNDSAGNRSEWFSIMAGCLPWIKLDQDWPHFLPASGSREINIVPSRQWLLPKRTWKCVHPCSYCGSRNWSTLDLSALYVQVDPRKRLSSVPWPLSSAIEIDLPFRTESTDPWMYSS